MSTALRPAADFYGYCIHVSDQICTAWVCDCLIDSGGGPKRNCASHLCSLVWGLGSAAADLPAKGALRQRGDSLALAQFNSDMKQCVLKTAQACSGCVWAPKYALVILGQAHV